VSRVDPAHALVALLPDAIQNLMLVSRVYFSCGRHWIKTIRQVGLHTGRPKLDQACHQIQATERAYQT
jgi:hypothetical protein